MIKSPYSPLSHTSGARDFKIHDSPFPRLRGGKGLGDRGVIDQPRKVSDRLNDGE